MTIKEEKAAIVKAVADALDKFSQYAEIKEDAVDNEMDFKLSIAVKILPSCERVEASVSGNVKYQSAAYAMFGDQNQLGLNFEGEGGEE